MTDPTSPSHYQQGEVECIDALRSALNKEEFEGYCRGAVIKYVWRFRHKGGAEDLKKAMVYLQWLLSSVDV